MESRASEFQDAASPRWEDLLRRYETWLRQRARHELAVAGLYDGPEAGAEAVREIVQEIYCRLLARQGRFRGGTPGEVLSYLARVTATVVADHARTLMAAKRGLQRRVELNPKLGVTDPAPTPEERAILMQGKRLFLRRFREVAGRQGHGRNARIVWLALIEGWRSRDIARVVGGELTPRTIDTMVNSFRRKLEAGGMELGGR